MQDYTAPAITDLGSFAGITLDLISKSTGGTDVVNYNDGSSIVIPGHGVTGVS